jgi:hypothetical protein
VRFKLSDPMLPSREMLIAAGFGIVHGMAFSFALAELNLDTTQMVLSLLGFNSGIEVTQFLRLPHLRTRLARGTP